MMFKNSVMKNLTAHRNQAINLECKSIDWFLLDMSLNQKEILNGPEYKNKILSKTHKYSLRVYILR